MAASTYFDAVQKLYIAYYGRPADPLGQAFWAGKIDAAGGNQSAVIDAFGTSAESVALYDAISVTARVNAVYQQTLGRDADVTGLSYYVGRINDGSLTLASLALAVLAGATTGDDATIVANKLAVANTFTAHIDTTAEILAYSGDAAAAAARTFLSTVTADAASVTAATANIDATIAALPGESSTFTLTDGVDTLIGTAGNDIFNATNATFNAFDSLDGGAGTDTLNIIRTDGSALTTTTAATVTGIENVSISNADAAITADVSDFSGLTSVTVNQAGVAVAVSVTTGGNATSVAVSGGAAVTVEDSATTDTLASVSLDGNTGAATITSDALTSLSLTDTTAATTIVAAAGTRELSIELNDTLAGIITDLEATSASIATSGTSNAHLHLDNITSLAIDGSGDLALRTDGDTDMNLMESLTISGSVSVTDDGSLAGNTGLTTITSTSTGDQDLTIAATATSVTTGAGDDIIRQTAALGATQVIATGAGDDNVRLGGALTAGASINGGDGTDTLTLTTAIATAVAADTEELVFSNFEKIEISNALAGNLDMSNLDDIQSLVLNGHGANSVAGLASGATIEQAAASAAVLTVTAGAAVTAGTSDVLNLVFGNAADTDFGGVTAAEVETVNIAANLVDTDAAVEAYTVDLTIADATTVNVSGDASLNLSGAALTSVTTFTSTTTGDVTVSFAGNTNAVTYTGAAGVDTVTLGSGANAVNLGAGDDVVTLNTAGLSTVTLGAGDDTVNVVATTSGNIYTTIADIATGDELVFVDQGAETFATAKLALADTAVFQDYLDLAAAGDGSVNGAISWFQFGGNTYVVEDLAAGATFTNGTDVVVKLSGLVDLSDAVQAGNALTLA